MLHPFPPVAQPPTHRPTIGDPLTLGCRPPYSFPTGVPFWAVLGGEHGDEISTIDLSDRVQQDYEGKHAPPSPLNL